MSIRKELKFEPGRIILTRGVADRVEYDNSFDHFITVCLFRHLTGDWGNLCEEDKKENEFAINNYARIFSAYDESNDKIWIITEADRSVTTILFPEEY